MRTEPEPFPFISQYSGLGLATFTCSSGTAAHKMWKSCGFPVQITAVMDSFPLAHLAPAVQHTTKAVVPVSSAETKGFRLQRDAERVFAAQRMEVTQRAHGQGIHHSPGGSARNSWKSLASAG